MNKKKKMLNKNHNFRELSFFYFFENTCDVVSILTNKYLMMNEVQSEEFHHFKNKSGILIYSFALDFNVNEIMQQWLCDEGIIVSVEFKI